jgi:Trp operon repressor
MEIQNLKDKISKGNYILDDFTKFYDKLNNDYNEFISLLEEAYENSRDKDLYKLLYSVKGRKVSELIERLKKYGYKLRQSEKLAEAFKNMGYRFLEMTRAGKRDEVFYGFLRIFISAKEEFPIVLVEIFKPHYSDETFKVFIYSFLSGIISQEEELTINKE